MSDDAPAVGLVGEDAIEVDVRTQLRDAGLDVAAGDAAAVLEDGPSVVVAVGDRAVAAVGSRNPSMPIVPVDAGAGVRSVPGDAVDAIPSAIAADDWTTEHHETLSVTVDGEHVETAVFDVSLLTAAAARISEYEVVADEDRLDRSRADGVVVATPAGSTGYARRVNAPVLAPGTGIAVAWIAPFRTDPDRWVVDPAALKLSVCRDEASVDLHVDDRVVGPIGPAETVAVAPTDGFSVAVFDVSRNRYER